ncbi:MAG: hypothetical protein JOZ04_03115 [Acidimicrobiia bacterium]|nr:hypothetical protein [Acidimicrobiia bacterium]
MAGGPALALVQLGATPSSSPPHVLSGALTVSASAPEPPPVEESSVAEPTTTVAPEHGSTAVAAVYTPVAQRFTAAPPTTTRRATPVRSISAPAKPAPKPAPTSESPGAGTAPQGRTQSGPATWYDAAPPGTCAHRTLPMGTVVTITSASGATATCTVDDRGPYADGAIIDLAKDVFSKLAPLSQGVVQVTISW